VADVFFGLFGCVLVVGLVVIGAVLGSRKAEEPSK